MYRKSHAILAACGCVAAGGILWAQAGEYPCYETVTHFSLCSFLPPPPPGNPLTCEVYYITQGGEITDCPSATNGFDNTDIRPKVTKCWTCELGMDSFGNCRVELGCSSPASTTHECFAFGASCEGGGGGGMGN